MLRSYRARENVVFIVRTKITISCQVKSKQRHKTRRRPNPLLPPRMRVVTFYEDDILPLISGSPDILGFSHVAINGGEVDPSVGTS
jgi:hypothetical protein